MSRLIAISRLNAEIDRFGSDLSHPVRLAKEAKLARYIAMSDEEYQAHIRSAIGSTVSRLATELKSKAR